MFFLNSRVLLHRLTTVSMAKYVVFFALIISCCSWADTAVAQILPIPQTSEAVDETEDSDAESSDSTEGDSLLNISDTISVDELANSWTGALDGWIDGSGLNQGIVQKTIFTVLLVVLGVLLFWLLKFLLGKLEGKAKSALRKAVLPVSKAHFYFNLIRALLATFIVFSTLVGVALVWELPVDDWLAKPAVTSLMGTLATLFIIVFIGSVFMELAVSLVERAFRRWGGHHTSRVDTLLPIAKNVVYITFLVIFILMALSEVGINVMPLLAGAGVVGFAVGFGAQTLIKDLLTGFIIILEDLIQVGDVVRLSGRAGLVEKITIRKVQLRDLSGIVYTVPFSEIDVVENLTKDFSYYIFDIGIAYREDADQVMDVLKAIDEDIRKDDDFNKLILEPLEIFGVDQFADSAVVIKARVKTQPIQQWTVGREYNRRMKIAFDQQGIEIPFPHQTIYFGEDKDGKAPPLRVKATNLSQDNPLVSAEEDAPKAQRVSSNDAPSTNAKAKNRDNAEHEEGGEH